MTLAVAAVFGLIGGAAVNMIGLNTAAFAQESGKAKTTKDKKPPAADDSKGKIITAREIRLAGDDGKVVARLKTSTHKEAGEQVMLVLSDTAGKERVRLFAAEKASGLDLCDESGKARIQFGQSSVGAPGSRCSMSMNDGEGQPKVEFDLTAMGALNCKITNNNGSGAQLFASVFKEKPMFQLVGNGGGEVWKAP
jgi:hypothetical protein